MFMLRANTGLFRIAQKPLWTLTVAVWSRRALEMLVSLRSLWWTAIYLPILL